MLSHLQQSLVLFITIETFAHGILVPRALAILCCTFGMRMLLLGYVNDVECVSHQPFF